LAKSRLKLITSYINLNKELKVLDIGAGNGQFGKALEEMKCNFIYDAVEPDLEVANQYTDNVVNHFSDISEVNESTYDLAVMNQVLEHVSDPVNFMITVSKLVKPGGYLYIDVPFQDYLFKPSVEPHILFWNPESLKTLSDKVGLKVLFCDTAGMLQSNAKRFFHDQTLIQKLSNSWFYQGKINSLFRKLGLPKPFNTFRQFQSDHYSGDRQWLRCIAQKI
jgi:SAM-dependent methyltransferase